MKNSRFSLRCFPSMKALHPSLRRAVQVVYGPLDLVG
jgi:hypothetical protein